MMMRNYGRSLLLLFFCAGAAVYATAGNAESTPPAVPAAPELPPVAQYEAQGPIRPDLATGVVMLTPIARDGTPVGPERAIRLTPVAQGPEQEE